MRSISLRRLPGGGFMSACDCRLNRSLGPVNAIASLFPLVGSY